MRSAREFTEDFMARLNAGDFSKVHQSNEGPEPSREFVKREIEGFDHLLGSKFAEAIINGPASI